MEIEIGIIACLFPPVAVAIAISEPDLFPILAVLISRQQRSWWKWRLQFVSPVLGPVWEGQFTSLFWFWTSLDFWHYNYISWSWSEFFLTGRLTERGAIFYFKSHKSSNFGWAGDRRNPRPFCAWKAVVLPSASKRFSTSFSVESVLSSICYGSYNYFSLSVRTSKILVWLNALIFFPQFEAQNVLILFLTAIYY